jgi:S-adenosylmethionine decarboxylase
MKAPFAHFVEAPEGYVFAGRHLIIEMWNGDFSNEEALSQIIQDACVKAGATVLSVKVHGFGEGCGSTGVVCLSESHASWHVWTECRYMALDIFMCGVANPWIAANDIVDQYPGVNSKIQELRRGVVHDHNRGIDFDPAHHKPEIFLVEQHAI